MGYKSDHRHQRRLPAELIDTLPNSTLPDNSLPDSATDMTTTETTQPTTETTQRNCLLVVANPEDDSFISDLADTASAAFSFAGWKVDTIDLSDYNPAMTIEDRRAYHTDNPIVDPIVRSHADMVLAAEALVFVYPVVWGTLPALLKGWFDRTMVVGVALKLVNGKVKRNLTKIRKVAALACDTSESRLPGTFHDGGKRLMKRTLTIITHPRCKSVYLQHHAIKAPGSGTDFKGKAALSLKKLAIT